MTDRTPLVDVVPPPFAVLGADGIDAELAALPAPSRARSLSGMALMVTVILLSVGLMVRFRGDLEYFQAASTAPRDLGRADRVSVGTLEPNEYVRLEGMPLAAGAVRFRRLARDGTFRIYPLAGQPKIFVERFTPEGHATARDEHGVYSGRMIRFAQAGGSYSSVRAYLEQRLGAPVGDDAWLLVDGETPRDRYWVVALYAMLGAFLLFNAFVLWRYTRPVTARPE